MFIFYIKYEKVENEFLYLINFLKCFKYNFISWKYFTLYTLLKFNKISSTKRFNNNILFYKIMYYNFTFLSKCITNGWKTFLY